MHAFDFVVLFFSFVYAAAVAHVLATTGEIVIAAKRIKISSLNAGWMLASLFLTCSWWIGFWDLHDIKVWPIGLVGIFFFIAAAIYVHGLPSNTARWKLRYRGLSRGGGSEIYCGVCGSCRYHSYHKYRFCIFRRGMAGTKPRHWPDDDRGCSSRSLC
jgi:hypothetical protein